MLGDIGNANVFNNRGLMLTLQGSCLTANMAWTERGEQMSEVSEWIKEERAMQEKCIAEFSLIVTQNEEGILNEESLKSKLLETMQMWCENSSGETTWCNEWATGGGSENGIWIIGSDFLRTSSFDRIDILNDVYGLLEKFWDVTDSDQCSFCGDCYKLINTNYDTEGYVVTDGNITCYKCAPSLIASGVGYIAQEEFWVKMDTDPFPLRHDPGLLLSELLNNWSVCLPLGSAFRSGMEEEGFTEILVDQYGYDSAIGKIGREEAEKVAGRLVMAKVPCFYMRGGYSWDMSLFYKTETDELEEKEIQSLINGEPEAEEEN